MKFIKIPSPAMVIAVVALCVALSGGAYAASKIKGKQIASGAISSKHIKNGTITEKDLSAALKAKLGTATTAAVAGARGADGKDGIDGKDGVDGTDGTNGTNGTNGAPGADADSVVDKTVTAASLKGWTLADYGDNSTVDGRGSEDATPNGSLTFATPPAAPPFGSKALRFQNTDGHTVVAYAPFPGFHASVPDSNQADNPFLSELTAASYSSLIHTQPQAALDVAMKIEVTGSSSTSFSSGYTTLVYEPAYNGGSDTTDVWHRYNARQGKWWSSKPLTGLSCPQTTTTCTLSEIMANSPNAVVQSVKFVTGQNSGAAWPGFDGYVDGVDLAFRTNSNFDLGN